MLTNYWKFPNRSVQTFGFVYHDTNGLNHGPVWKTQLFLLSGICMVILWQDYYGKGNLRKSYCSTVGWRFPIGNACSYTVKKGYSYLCMWMTSLAGKKQNLHPMWKLLNHELDDLTCQVHDNWLCLSRHDAAEVYSPEEHRHAETNPMCKIHESRCTSRRHSRPKFFARIHLPRWTSSAQPQRFKIWGSVSGRDGVARARSPWSSVEAGQKFVRIKGARKSNILLTFGKLVPACINS